MKKLTLTLALMIGCTFHSYEAQAGLISKAVDKVKGLFGKSSSSPTNDVERLQLILTIEDNISKMSLISEEYNRKLANFKKDRADLYNINRNNIENIRKDIQLKTDAIIKAATQELTRLKEEKKTSSSQLKPLEDSIIQWQGYGGAASLFRGDDPTAFNALLGYAGNFAGNSVEDMKKKKNDLINKIEGFKADIATMKAVLADPRNQTPTNNQNINKFMADSAQLNKDLDDFKSIVNQILNIPEELLRNYAEFTKGDLYRLQEDLQAQVVAVKCPGIKSWTAAILDTSQGGYVTSPSFNQCKLDIIKKVSQTDSNASCKTLGVTSNNPQIEQCIKASS